MLQRLARPVRIALTIAPLALQNEKPRDRQLPIYPIPSPKPEVVENPTQLEASIRETRVKLTEIYQIGRAHTQMVVDKWIGVESAVETRVKSLLPPPEEEPLLPGALWVGIASLSGSIIASQLGPSRVRRLIYPPIWGLIAAGYFLPLTTVNIGKYVYELEERYTPGLAKLQTRAMENSVEVFESSRKSIASFRKGMDIQVGKLSDTIREKTGLKIGEKKADK